MKRFFFLEAKQISLCSSDHKVRWEKFGGVGHLWHKVNILRFNEA